MKKIVNGIVESFPNAIKNLIDWTKDNFDENAQRLLENSSGSVGLLIEIFGKSLVDEYFSKREADKLSNFGEQTYLKSAFKQAEKSIKEIESNLDINIEGDSFKLLFSEMLTKGLEVFTKDKLIVIFRPEYHPSVVYVKETCVTILRNSGVNEFVISSFLNDFNKNISNEVEITFGESYEKHTQQISSYLIAENEAKLLWDTSQLGKIGFVESESLKYEETFASWEDVSALKGISNERSYIDDINDDESDNDEERLVPIVDLIEEYFKINPASNLDKILFIVADFGKGKSVFLRHYASELAKEYALTRNGEFPIYFNLRNFNNYSHNTQLGVLEDYLLTEYAIDITSTEFAKKRYVFLIDSLDESGELDKLSIEKVINSIKQIQNLDKEKYRTNKIIITTRPFDDGLDQHLKNHKPKLRFLENKRGIPQLISIYGFKRDQFNDWILNSLKGNVEAGFKPKTSIGIEIIDSIRSNSDFDVYQELINNNTLSASELRRPIFAYMIYQLILNNVNFLDVGKIGVYLSFLNLLSKDAKHINDPNYNVNLKEEFGFRSLLHSISALWMFERHQGKQGSLSKADICRVLEGDKKEESDSEILERFQNKGVIEIKFLSHSYFGENDNKLHFQHQSFAEILLAEYYLKVLIKYALDIKSNIDDARSKLILGIPTEQTMNFFVELLKLLLESTNESNSPETLEKRKLLFPLMATLGTQENNNLFCTSLYFQWFQKAPIDDYETSYPEGLIEDWCFDKEKIKKVLELCRDIINSKNTFVLSKGKSKSALFDSELTVLQNSNLSDFTLDFDKWIALLVGNTLGNDFNSNEPILFNTVYSVNPEVLFDLIVRSSGRPTNLSIIPTWGKKLFRGIDMSDINLNRINVFAVLNGLDFSYSKLKNLDLSGCLLGGTKFDNTNLKNVNFSHSYMWDTSFKKLKFVEGCRCSQVVIADLIIPFSLVSSGSKNTWFDRSRIINPLQSHIIIPKIRESEDRFRYNYIEDVLSVTIDFFAYYYSRKEISVRKINELVKFESGEDRKKYIDKIKEEAKMY